MEKYFDDEKTFIHYLGKNIEKEIPGLAPQAQMGLQAFELISKYYKDYKKYNMARLLLITTNTGAGKSGFDWTLPFLLSDGMLYWPENKNSYKPRDVDGILPIVLVISQNEIILTQDFLPLLKKRHPYLYDDCFVFLDPKQIKKGKRGTWLKDRINQIKHSKHGEGIYILALTPKLLTCELASYFENEKKLKKYLKNRIEKHEEEEEKEEENKRDENEDKSIWPYLTNIRLLILDEVDALGTQSVEKKLGGFSSANVDEQLQTIKKRFKNNSGCQAIALTYLITLMKKSFPHEHLVVGLSATLSTGKSSRALTNYIGLAGGFPTFETMTDKVKDKVEEIEEIEEERKVQRFSSTTKKKDKYSQLVKTWKDNCIFTYISDPICKIQTSIYRCQMSSIVLKLHDFMLDYLLNQVETTENHKLKAGLELKLINYCYAISLGLDIAMSNEYKIAEFLNTLPDAEHLVKEIQEEIQKKDNPLSVKAVHLLYNHMKKNPKCKYLIFYSRIAQAESFRQVFIHLLNKTHHPNIYKKEDLLIFCGKRTYYGSKYSGMEASKEFKKPLPSQPFSKLKRKKTKYKNNNEEELHFLKRVMLMSMKSARGQNFGFVDYYIILGSGQDANNLVQSLGRGLRAGSISDKTIILILPQKELLASEISCALVLHHLCDMPNLQHEKMWYPIIQITKDLFNTLKSENKIDDHENEKEYESQQQKELADSLTDHKSRQKFASQAYKNIKIQWKQKQGKEYNEKDEIACESIFVKLKPKKKRKKIQKKKKDEEHEQIFDLEKKETNKEEEEEEEEENNNIFDAKEQEEQEEQEEEEEEIKKKSKKTKNQKKRRKKNKREQNPFVSLEVEEEENINTKDSLSDENEEDYNQSDNDHYEKDSFIATESDNDEDGSAYRIYENEIADKQLNRIKRLKSSDVDSDSENKENQDQTVNDNKNKCVEFKSIFETESDSDNDYPRRNVNDQKIFQNLNISQNKNSLDLNREKMTQTSIIKNYEADSEKTQNRHIKTEKKRLIRLSDKVKKKGLNFNLHDTENQKEKEEDYYQDGLEESGHKKPLEDKKEQKPKKVIPDEENEEQNPKKIIPDEENEEQNQENVENMIKDNSQKMMIQDLDKLNLNRNVTEKNQIKQELSKLISYENKIINHENTNIEEEKKKELCTEIKLINSKIKDNTLFTHVKAKSNLENVSIQKSTENELKITNSSSNSNSNLPLNLKGKIEIKKESNNCNKQLSITKFFTPKKTSIEK